MPFLPLMIPRLNGEQVSKLLWVITLIRPQLIRGRTKNKRSAVVENQSRGPGRRTKRCHRVPERKKTKREYETKERTRLGQDKELEEDQRPMKKKEPGEQQKPQTMKYNRRTATAEGCALSTRTRPPLQKVKVKEMKIELEPHTREPQEGEEK